MPQHCAPALWASEHCASASCANNFCQLFAQYYSSAPCPGIVLKHSALAMYPSTVPLPVCQRHTPALCPSTCILCPPLRPPPYASTFLGTVPRHLVLAPALHNCSPALQPPGLRVIPGEEIEILDERVKVGGQWRTPYGSKICGKNYCNPAAAGTIKCLEGRPIAVSYIEALDKCLDKCLVVCRQTFKSWKGKMLEMVVP